MKHFVINNFKNIFGNKECNVYFAPGRVNLIGEHIDYNGGRVLPFAIKIGTYGVVALRDDTLVRVYSENFKDEGIIEFDLESLPRLDSYAAYIVGMIVKSQVKDNSNVVSKGFDLYLYGNIPNGSGLSSSASLTVLIGYILNDLFNFNLTRTDIALLGQSTEKYVGVNCGIMDHFASANGKSKSAILLNTNSLSYNYVELDLKDHIILVANTNKKRKLTDSKYNERRSECDKSYDVLRNYYNISYLCDLKVSDLENAEKILNDDVLFRRVRHVVSENDRVNQTCELLKNGDLEGVGKILNASHKSLKNDYEVTGVELDTIVAALQMCDGVLGARMVGAGFGGCAIALVKKDFVKSICERVNEIYTGVVGYEPSFYEVEVGNGVCKL